MKYSTSDQSPIVKPAEAATILGASERYLRYLRAKRQGPPPLRYGKRTVRYRLVDLQAWANKTMAEGYDHE